ncbi:HEAT repeat domain-containing protein [Sorangium sp. So ce1000]|uniref:HEAT repeat domain-containing protein n=1 Tax=Sorangium sp. So ce1000 TaxID=3133325 RepID=UPI003F601C72
MSDAIGHYEKVRALAIGPRLLAVGGVRAPAPSEARGTRETQTTRAPAGASQVTLFDHVANKPVRSIDVPAHVLGLAFAGDLLAAACSDGALRLLTGGGADGRAIDAHPGGATAIAAGVSLNAGARLATVGADGALRLWRIGEAAGSPAPQPGAAVAISSFALSAAPLRAVAFDPAGELCAAAGDDGVVRVVTLSTGAVRDMPGHDGPVTALAFTPRDGRLASGGDDGTVRLWYLVGDVECEVRGADGSGHAGGVRALLCLPTPPPQDDGKEGGDRLLSAGADGAIRIHRLEDRRKPRTLETSALPLYALALMPAASARKGARAGRGGADAKDGLGAVFAAGDRRTVWRFPIDAAGAPADGTVELAHGFDVLAQALSGARPARESAVKTLASLDEPEALEAALPVLRSDRDAEVRALAARELGAKGRRDARAKLREALDDESPNVRMAALEALRAIERDAPLAPLRAALGARAADVQRRALLELGKLYGSSPLIPGLIAEKLAGRDASVRLTALDQLQKIHPDGPQPLRAAFERGPSDLRVEALIRAALAGWLSAPEFAPIAARALDDEDAEVRRIAFAAKVIERRALAHALEARDEDLGRAAIDIARRAAEVLRRAGAGGAEKPAPNAKDGAKDGAKAADDAAIKAARAKIPGVGSPGSEPAEADLEPLLTAMACRTPDTAVRGARGLAQLGDTRALGALLQLTREQDPSLRRQAATALAELRDTRAEKRLIWMLDDADGAVRAAALDAYARLEPSAPLAVAEASLRSSQEDIRVRGLDRLVALAGEGKGPKPPEAEALLADAIEDESPKVRREAFRTLWSWHASDPQTALDRAQLARFPDLRLRAVEELKAHGEQPWAAERLHAAIGDRDASVAQAAYDAVVKLRGKEAAEPHLAAMASIHPSVRESGARGAARIPAGDDARSALLRLLATRVPVGDDARSALIKLLEDEHAGPRIAAIEALDKLLPGEAGPLHIGLQSSHLDLRVRAAELCAVRRDEQLINPMRALLADQSLLNAGRGSAFAVPSAQLPIQVLGPLRARAATALATLGSPRLVKYFATELLKDEYPDVREQAARGLAMAARRGEEGYLLDAMGHADVAVRSWAADGLARLGDVRALPVLTGTLRHEHPPIRVATIMSFAALGPEGYGGMLQGLEDSSRDVQEIVFAIVLARDLRAFRRGDPPDLLTSALSSQRSDVRFAAARALELRADPEAYLAHLIDVLMPPRPDAAAQPDQGSAADGEKPGGMKDWPPEAARGRILVGLAEALASDDPQQRYAAAQVLRIRRKPVEYFREAKRVAALRPAGAPVPADTTPRAAEESDTKPAKGWLRRLFSQPGPSGQKSSDKPAGDAVPEGEQRRLRWLAFGAYMGLLRQASPGDDEAHRTRRDAIDRIVDVCAKGHVSSTAAIPPLVRALDDPHHLVRKAAFAGLKALFPEGAGEPLALGLASASADVARTALDEIAARGGDARPEIVRALSSPLADVRRYAFELLERLSPKGSLDPLLAALGSEHADLRLGVLERLASSSDPRIVPALCRAMESDHDDLRLRAAELLARSRDDRAVDVLSAFLREGAAASAARARKALVALASDAAVRALAARMDEATAPADRAALAGALGNTRRPAATGPLAARFDDESAEVRGAALKACLEIVDKGREREKRDTALALAFLSAAARAKDPALRLAAARELDLGDDPAQNDLLAALFADRDLPTRVAAVTSYAKRVKGDRQERAPSGPLEAVLRAGARELVLPAAEGVAERGLAAALRPLLLVVRAGEPGERERALLALGTLGDARALDELEAVAAGGTKDAAVNVGRGSASAAPSVEPTMQAAATEALGRIAPKLGSAELRKRASERVEQALHADSVDLRESAARGVRWIGGERARVLLEELVRAGDTPDRLRVVAVNELGLLGDRAAEPALARALDARSGEVRKGARKALEKLFPGERTRVELLAVGSEHDDIAGPAASYLAAEADPAELLPRLAAIKDEDLRQRLAMGLLRRGGLPAAALARMLEDERAPARREAARLIAAGTVTGDRAALAGALAAAAQRTAERWSAAHGDERDAEAAAWRELLWAAARAGATATAPALRALLADAGAPGEVRREAARSLGALESAARSRGAAQPAGAVEALTAALKDMDAGVRASAAAALAALAPDGSAAIAAAVRPFDPVAFGPTARVASPEALSALAATEPGRRLALPSMLARHDVAALAPLISLAQGNGGDAAARLDAIAALGRAGGERALEALAALAFDKNKKTAEVAVRKAAFRAYRRAKRKAADPRAARLAAARSPREPETPEGANA